MARNASNYKIIMNNNQKNACLELVCIVGYFRNIVYKDTGAHLSPCMQMWIKIKQSKTHIYKLSVSVSYVCPSKTCVVNGKLLRKSLKLHRSDIYLHSHDIIMLLFTNIRENLATSKLFKLVRKSLSRPETLIFGSFVTARDATQTLQMFPGDRLTRCSSL